MIRLEFRKELENQQKVLLIVWTGFIVATVLYLSIPQFLPDLSQSLGGYPLAGTIRQGLWIIVLIEVGFLFWWNKKVLTKEAIGRNSREARWMPNLVRGHQNRLEEEAARTLSFYVIGKIIAFAVAESLAIYGLFLAYSGRYFWDQYILSSICLLLLIYLYPRRSFLIGLITECHSLEGN